MLGRHHAWQLGTVTNREAWDIANRKYVEEDDTMFVLALAHAHGGSLLAIERELLAPVLADAPFVVHLQSGNAIDDFALVAAGARFVAGVDFSSVAAAAAAGRATRAGLVAAYVTSDAACVALASGCADLVYTGRGSLVWLGDLEAWAAEVFRLLRPGGVFFAYDAHPLAGLWTLDPEVAGIDPTGSYFRGTRPNTSFPASAIARFTDAGDAAPPAIEHQWPLSTIVGALLDAGLVLRHLGEHAEPFWRPADGSPPARAWDGSLPNSFSVLAERPIDRGQPSAPV